MRIFISTRTLTRRVFSSRRYVSGLSVRFMGIFVDYKKYRHPKRVHRRKRTVLMGSAVVASILVRINRYEQRFLNSLFSTLFKAISNAFPTELFSIFTGNTNDTYLVLESNVEYLQVGTTAWLDLRNNRSLSFIS